uniref:Metallophosphoesterase 1 homolog n=1 Tax=Culicoides sonorensis TaxID=179676 RepID=A0A336LLC1_CULSO
MRLKIYLVRVFLCLLSLFFFNEFLIYYLVLWQCKWPEISPEHNGTERPASVKVMLLADTHLLGPFQGHWYDKLRREWQMHRAFQSALTIFTPELIFILGDVFDEGKWVNDQQYKEYLDRYFRIFNTHGTKSKLISIVGNHDIGFHYAAHPYLTERFYRTMNSSGVQLFTFKNVHFITINSIAMEGDGCQLCEGAERELIRISYQLECARGVGNCEKIPKIGPYSRPIVLQHYPFYRASDKECHEKDSELIERFREGWEVLSKDATNMINKLLKPRVGFSGHSHHYCHLTNRLMKIEEYTLASFSWRNKNNPSFLLTEFTDSHYWISKCDMPKESTVINLYIVGAFLALIVPCIRLSQIIKKVKHSLNLGNKRNKAKT